MDDGALDFSAYTLKQLREAMTSIDSARYPVNYRRLSAELQTRLQLASTVDEPRTEDWFRYRVFWRRLAAGILDSALLIFVAQLLIRLATGRHGLLASLAPLIGGHVAPVAYELTLLSRMGATVGKMAMGIRVLSLDETTLPTVRQAALRNIVGVIVALAMTGVFVGNTYFLQRISLGVFVAALFVLNWLVVLWFCLEFFTMWTNAKRRALHDFIAGTVVVRARATTTSASRNALDAPRGGAR
jgi:uncharacterized RDD family membrane protein YckC